MEILVVLSPAGPASPGDFSVGLQLVHSATINIGENIKINTNNFKIRNFKSVQDVGHSGFNFQRPDFKSNATHRPRRFWLAFVLFTKLLEWKN